MIFLKVFLVIILTTFISCQDYNSNSFDQDRFGKIDVVGGPDFAPAYRVLQKRCTTCHSHAQWAEYKNEQDWVRNESLIVPGQPEQSLLIRRIFNSGAAGANMPLGDGPLPAEEYQLLIDWIEAVP